MNRSPLSSRLILLALLLAGVSSVWWIRARQLQETRRTTRDLEAERVAVQQQTAVARQQLEELKHQVTAEKTARIEATANAAQLVREIPANEPSATWTTPPANLPSWDAHSPYVWLRKEALPNFPFQPFERNGSLNPGLPGVLVIEPAKVVALNRQLSGLVKEYQKLEVAHAEPTTDHPPGTGSGRGERLSFQIPPMPEESARLKQAFEAALRDNLGEQRADLLLRAGYGWLDSQFSANGTMPKIYSVLRHPDGSFNISVNTGGSSMSVGGPRTLDHYIPDHLQHLFSALNPGTGDTSP